MSFDRDSVLKDVRVGDMVVYISPNGEEYRIVTVVYKDGTFETEPHPFPHNEQD